MPSEASLSTPRNSRRGSLDMKISEETRSRKRTLPLGKRLKHFTWAWYTQTMATGGIATLLSIQPHPFPGLLSIGATFYILNLVLFALISAALLLRFARFPGTFTRSLKHKREALFLGPFLLSLATILTGTQKYIVQMYASSSSPPPPHSPSQHHPHRASWLLPCMAAAFWLYSAASFLLAVAQYSFLFAAHSYPLAKFMPSWLLPIFPIMLAGTVASVIAEAQPLASRMPMIVAGIGCQGLGFLVSMLMYAHYIGRLMQDGYPDREHRSAMFIGVGPPSFTCLALIGMARALPDHFDLQRDGLMDGDMLRTLALVVALFLWVLAMWFFLIALVAVLHSRPKKFHLGMWAMVFPNTGFVIATINIGDSLQDEAIRYVGNALTVALVVLWAVVFWLNVRALIVGDIAYPGRDEDVED